jgi:hypothetical protein
MRKSLLLLALSALLLSQAARAEVTNRDEAGIVAKNFVSYVIASKGSWGEHASARVTSVRELRRGDRILAYVCAVEPVGYVVVSLYKDLSPIKAYSVKSTLDPDATQGLTDFMRASLDLLYKAIEERLGRPLETSDDLRAVTGRDPRGGWTTLASPSFDASAYRTAGKKTRSPGMDYQQGDELLQTTWDQTPPYNNQCPDHGCSWSGYGYYNENAYVGCVATAGAQILKYYDWPPEGPGGMYSDPYDWANMADSYDYVSGQFVDQDSNPVTQAQIDAVAEVSREVGAAVAMDYGCDESGAYTDDLEQAFQNCFRYHDGCGVLDRISFMPLETWFAYLQEEFNHNRPVVYRIPDHAIVSDGWDIQNVGGSDHLLIHIVYGWNGSNDGWYSPNEIPGGDPDVEYIVFRIRPDCSLGESLSGTYEPPYYPYRYFNRDASGSTVTFAAGNYLQVLRSGFHLTNSGTLGTDHITFEGTEYDTTVVYINGDRVGGERMRIEDGAVKIWAGGQIAIY